MIKVGVTGGKGFIGTHLSNMLRLMPDKFVVVSLDNDNFDQPEQLRDFVRECDAIVHLAALNRHNDPQLIYDTNIRLVKQLIAAFEDANSKPHIVFASSTQESRENQYGNSKKEGRILFQEWARRNNSRFTGLIIPNVFGPFGNPFYNSVIATFSHQLTHGVVPHIEVDAKLNLIYVGELVQAIVACIVNETNEGALHIPHTASFSVSELLGKLQRYKNEYLDSSTIPALDNEFELQLFNTFRSYIDHKVIFPRKLLPHTDHRGSFVELIRLGSGGQVSFSTTHPGVTRGNHFHTRKIERFAVIKGRALIQLRRVGTSEVLEYQLDGDEPSYVDMPIWHTHNITNVGDDVLYTIFWINEIFSPDDPDTFFEKV